MGWGGVRGAVHERSLSAIMLLWRQLLRKSKPVCVCDGTEVVGWAVDATKKKRTREIDPKPPSQADRPLTEELCDSCLSSSEPPYPLG